MKPPDARRPNGCEWQYVDEIFVDGNRIARWRSGPILVCSSLTIAELPDGAGIGPQWQISISATGKRPKDHHVRRALRAFGMTEAEEDNHHPGVARHFFLVVDPAHRVDCECKTTETTVMDPDGYRWSNATDGTCRGCEYQAAHGRPCPIHAIARGLER